MTRLMKTFAALAVASLAAAPAFAGSAASPVGKWQVTTGDARYSVTACGDGLCAKLVWLSPDQRTAENLALLNTYVVKGAVEVDDNKWQGSVVMDGRAFAGTMTMVSADMMKLRGCSGMLCQTLEFTRI
ncbi:MAG: DUF2147 domain-containing protein [Devosia sp.]